MAKKKKKQALGRGLSALLDDPEREIRSASDVNADQVVGNIIELEVDKIEVNPYQPRTHFNEQAIGELAESIKSLGIIQPVTVRKVDRNQYQLVSGNAVIGLQNQSVLIGFPLMLESLMTKRHLKWPWLKIFKEEI